MTKLDQLYTDTEYDYHIKYGFPDKEDGSGCEFAFYDLEVLVDEEGNELPGPDNEQEPLITGSIRGYDDCTNWATNKKIMYHFCDFQQGLERLNHMFNKIHELHKAWYETQRE